MPTVKEMWKKYYIRFFVGFLVLDEEYLIEKAKANSSNVEKLFQLMAVFVKRKEFIKFLKLANIIAFAFEKTGQLPFARAMKYKKVYLYYYLRKKYKKL